MQDFNTWCVRGDASATGCDMEWLSVWCETDDLGATDPLADTALASIAMSGVCETMVAELASPAVALVADEVAIGGPGYSAVAWDDSIPLMVEDEEFEDEDEDDDFDDEDEEFEDDFEDEDDDFDDDDEDEFDGDEEE